MTAPETLRHGSGKTMTLVHGRLALRTNEPISADLRKSILKIPGVSLDSGTGPKGEEPLRRPAHRANLIFLRVDGDSTDEAEKLLTEHIPGKLLRYIAPIYQLAGFGTEGLLVVDPEVVIVHAEKSELLKKHGLAIDGERSKGLGHFALASSRRGRVYGVVEDLLDSKGGYAEYDCAHVYETAQLTPVDPQWGTQTNLQRIGLTTAWDTTRGAVAAHIAVLDAGGIQLGHEDIDAGSRSYRGRSTSGIWSATNGNGTGAGAHPTQMVGIVWAQQNTRGVAGIAPNCTLLYVELNPTPSTSEIMGALTAANAGAPGFLLGHVILFPHAGPGWDGPALATTLDTVGDTSVVCVPTGATPFPEGASTDILFPATHPKVLACGATSHAGNDDPRLTSAPTGEGSRYSGATSVSLTATGLDIPTTNEGNTYAVARGTSAAAATVAGVAALLKSSEPALTAQQIRDRLLTTARKISPHPYAYDSVAYPQLTRSPAVGFGEVNAAQALDYADIYIKDGPGDVGAEPSGVAAFWADGHIMIFDTAQTPTEAVFDANASVNFKNPTTAAPAHAYVLVKNKGPGIAKNVKVRLVLNSPATGFGFPRDWQQATSDTTHIVARNGNDVAQTEVTIAAIQPNTSAVAYFVVNEPIPWFDPATMTDAHICSLAMASSANDHPFNAALAQFAGTARPGEQTRWNNIVQRNMTVLRATSPWKFTFLIGGNDDQLSDVHFDFKGLKLEGPIEMKVARVAGLGIAAASTGEGDSITLLDDARLHVRVGSVDGTLTVKAGSHFEPRERALDLEVDGRSSSSADGLVHIDQDGRLRIKRLPGQRFRASIQIPLPSTFGKSDTADVDIIERGGGGRIAGGIRLRLTR